MLFALPPSDVLYQALLDRDPLYEGRAWVCVTSTRIFCRLTCPARKPLARNCVFHDTVAACLEAGFRPCKRCKPLETLAKADPAVVALTQALQADPSRRWTEADVAAMGHDPSTIRRMFKRHFGITFLDMARLARIRSGAEALRAEARVIDAQLDAGFESGSGFRAAFARILGRAPASFRGGEALQADFIDTPLGAMIAVADQHALHLLEFFDRKALPAELKRLSARCNAPIGIGRFAPTDQIAAELAAFFAGEDVTFKTPLALAGSPFSRGVWAELRRIRPGETRSYAQLAAAISRPSAVRAVAQANGANVFAIVIPCHRVIGADGSLTGYGGGLWRKQWLLAHESGRSSLPGHRSSLTAGKTPATADERS